MYAYYIYIYIHVLYIYIYAYRYTCQAPERQVRRRGELQRRLGGRLPLLQERIELEPRLPKADCA